LCEQQAPFYHEFAKNNQASTVQYLSIMIAGSQSGQSCEDWSKIGQAAGDENKYTLTLNDG
jgi:heat shock protein HspQ